MLAEMYEHLSEVYPTHGLEIVFVSSDRDEPSFRNYYQSMPWRAIPFDQLQFLKQALNMTYGVRGIPSFVVLDAVSGQVEAMLESWLSRTPAATQELLSMLELSTHETTVSSANVEPDDTEYLRRNRNTINSGDARIDGRF